MKNTRIIAFMLCAALPLSACGESGAPEETGEDTSAETGIIVAEKGDDFRSPASDLPENVYVNQVGYFTNGEKRAVVSGGGNEFSVIESESGREVYRGFVEAVSDGVDGLSGEVVCAADFSGLTVPGKYYLRVGEITTPEFVIGDDVYSGLIGTISKSWYYLRCGQELSEESIGEFAHAACHTYKSPMYVGFEEGKKPEVSESDLVFDAEGGWHDAGDYSKWVTSGAGGIVKMFASYMIYPELFGDDTGIAESGNGVPDILDEARYELEWIFKMQNEDGSVYSMVFPYKHPAFDMTAAEDRQYYYVYPVGFEAAGSLAVSAAWASMIFGEFDPEFSERCLDAAKKAQKWLDENPDYGAYSTLGYKNGYGSGVTAGNVDVKCGAPLMLYIATGDKRYEEAAESLFGDGGVQKEYFGGSLISFAYLAAKLGGFDIGLSKLLKRVEQLTKNRALTLATEARLNSYGLSGGDPWIYYNMQVTRAAIQLGIAELINPGKGYDGFVQDCGNYLLGTNPFGMSWITGVGSYYVDNLHYREGVMGGVRKHSPAGFMPFGPGSYEGELKNLRYKGFDDFFAEPMPTMKCYINTVKGSENHIMTEFTESSQGLPLLMFTILAKLSAEN